KIDQTTWPAAQRPVEMLINAQPSRFLPSLRRAALAQAAEAIAAARASPMSSMAITVFCPNGSNLRVSAYRTEATATVATATAKILRRRSQPAHALSGVSEVKQPERQIHPSNRRESRNHAHATL